MTKALLWCFPLAVIAAQLLPPEYSLAIGIAFAALGLTKRFRVLLLFGFSILGHLIWLFTSQYLTVNILNPPLLTVLMRLGLIGYIILFAIWSRFQPCNGYFRLGGMKETLRFPLIWWGFNERVWRFLLIFCFFFLIAAAFFSIGTNITEVLLYGLLFAAVNSIFEGVLWRGFILGRVVDYIGEKQGLVLTSIAFGFYHLSLGFSIWICLVFAIGGFYMGGIAIKSRGLFAPIIMQFFVNIAFVSFGIIF
jgi:membrane protease YdiL (CAAX protease family)